MCTRVLALSAAALLSVAAAATLSNKPGIDWPAAPASQILSAGHDGGGNIDWPAPTSPTIDVRGGETGAIDWP